MIYLLVIGLIAGTKGINRHGDRWNRVAYFGVFGVIVMLPSWFMFLALGLSGLIDECDVFLCTAGMSGGDLTK